MKRILLVLSVALIMAVMLAIAAPTFAAETGCGGDDYYFAEDFAEPGSGGDDGFLSCGEGPPWKKLPDGGTPPPEPPPEPPPPVS